MFEQLRRYEVYCDAPPYGVVRACERCGFRSPMDVRWRRLSHVLSEEGSGKGLFSGRLWHWLFGAQLPKSLNCSCGAPLPDLNKYAFTFLSQKAGEFLLGQCGHCRTMYWEEVLPLPGWIVDQSE
jgi:hypothetical protein